MSAAFASALVLSTVVRAATLDVPSPEYPTIAAAIDSARSGDAVRLAPGTYSGPGNQDLDYQGKAITIESSSGPEETTIDCSGAGRAFIFHHGEGTGSVLRGVTIRNGNAVGNGGGILCISASPTLDRVAILGCVATTGGGLACFAGNPDLRACTIAGNRALSAGGGIEVFVNGAVQLHDTIVWGNCAQDGAELRNQGTVGLECSVLPHSGTSGDGVFFWNDGGWIDSDPRFCDPASCAIAPTTGGEYGLHEGSSGLPDGNACQRLLGAFGLECSDPTPIKAVSWGSVKHRYGEAPSTKR